VVEHVRPTSLHLRIDRRPKGVAVTHANMAARVRWMVEAYQLAPRRPDRAVRLAGCDGKTEGRSSGARRGARNRLPRREGGPADFLADRRVTVLDLPTAYWNQLVDLIDELAWPDALTPGHPAGSRRAGPRSTVARAVGSRVRLVNVRERPRRRSSPTAPTSAAAECDADRQADRRDGVRCLDCAGRLVRRACRELETAAPAWARVPGPASVKAERSCPTRGRPGRAPLFTG